MAQTLKTEKKEAIIKAAISLMIEKGIENTDMRSIALKSNVTVGNLYRYFKDRQTLINEITSPLIREIDSLVINNSFGELSINKSDVKVLEINNFTPQLLDDLIINTVMGCYDLIQKNKEVMLILLQDNYFKTIVSAWIENIILVSFKTDKLNNIMLKVHVTAFVNAINTSLFYAVDLNRDEFSVLINKYIVKQNKILVEIIGEENEKK